MAIYPYPAILVSLGIVGDVKGPLAEGRLCALKQYARLQIL